jgi:hypothetical protein
LADGRVLVAGGGEGGGTGGEGVPTYGNADLYDPGANRWSRARPMGATREFPTATLLPSGKVLVAGGSIDGLPCCGATGAAEVYDPARNQWTPAAGMATARFGHTATLLPNGKVLVAGGSSNNGDVVIADVELYDPATNRWSAAASMLHQRSGHTATLLPTGKVLVTGGFVFSDDPFRSTELYDPATDRWTPAADKINERSGPAVLLRDGRVLDVGGAELYDPTRDAWSPAAPPPSGRTGGPAVLLGNGDVLAVGGDGRAALYHPATDQWSLAASMTTALQDLSATLLASGDVLVVGHDGCRPSGTAAERYRPAGSGSADAPSPVRCPPVTSTTTPQHPSSTTLGTLPFTGRGSLPLLAIAVALTTLGLACLAAGQRDRRGADR